MIKWLFAVIIGWPWCAHKWAIHRTERVWTEGHEDRPTGMIYVLRCEKCGDIKKRAISA